MPVLNFIAPDIKVTKEMQARNELHYISLATSVRKDWTDAGDLFISHGYFSSNCKKWYAVCQNNNYHWNMFLWLQ